MARLRPTASALDDTMAQSPVEEHAAETADGGFNAGEVIIEHVSNSSLDHPLIHLPTIFGIDFSVTKHVLMLWLVAATLFVVITWAVRRYLRQGTLEPSGFMNGLEFVVEFIRDSIVRPNVGQKWVNGQLKESLETYLSHPAIEQELNSYLDD